jgi:hypothetical protein
MKPDYVKIIFVGIPLTFIFWVVAFICVGSITHNADISTWISLSLTALFIPIYLVISKKYAKQLKSVITEENNELNNSVNKAIPKSSGIIALVFIILLVVILAVCGIFFNIEVNKAYQYAIIPIAIIMSLAERYFRKHA